MKRRILFSLLVVLISTLFAVPKWYENPRSYFDSREFLVGVGMGSDYDQALAAAKTDLLQQLSVKVQSTTDVQSKSIESEGKEFFSESIQKATKMTVEQTMQGIEVMQQDVDKKNTYILVSLNKLKMLNALQGELTAKSKAIRALTNGAESLAGQGQIISAIKNYVDAQKLIPDFYSRKALYDSFADTPYQIGEDITVNGIESDIRTLLASIRFDVVSGNQQTSKKGSMLPEPIVFKVSYRSTSGSPVPIVSFPVKVEYSDGVFIEKGLTNSEGTFSANVMATPLNGERGKVVIKMDAFMLPSYFNSYVNAMIGEAYFKTSETSSVNVRVSVKDAANVKQPKVERRLTKVLNENNVQVNDISPLFMMGTLSVKEVKTIESMGSPKTLAVVEMDIQFGIIKTKEILGTITASGKGMSDKSEKDAIEKAYDNLNISSRELKQMLSSAESKIQEALMRAVSYEEPQKSVQQQVPQNTQPSTQTEPVKQESPQVKQSAETPVSKGPDIHGFNEDDVIYTNKAFTNNSKSLWGRVGKITIKATVSTNNQAEIFDHEKGVKVWTDLYNKTAPAEINNIKEGDVIYVFCNGKRPLDRRQAITEQWKMVRITSTEDLFKGVLHLSDYPYDAPLEACRIILK